MTSRLESISSDDVAIALKTHGLRVEIGPFVISIRADVPGFSEVMRRCYSSYNVAPSSEFADAQISIERESRYLLGKSKSCVIRLNGGGVYTKFPHGSELPYMEWGINLCIASRAHQYLMLHAGVLERDGVAMLLPGLPGSGKSTLSAYLMHNGWRLLSDEFTLLQGPGSSVRAFPRLVPLKNESIEVIREEIPNAKFGPIFTDTPKGTVAHVCPPGAHINRMHEPAEPKLIIFPRYLAGSKTELVADNKPRSFVELTKHAFNYILRGKNAFETTTELVDNAACFQLTYSNLEEAASRIRTEQLKVA